MYILIGQWLQQPFCFHNNFVAVLRFFSFSPAWFDSIICSLPISSLVFIILIKYFEFFSFFWFSIRTCTAPNFDGFQKFTKCQYVIGIILKIQIPDATCAKHYHNMKFGSTVYVFCIYISPPPSLSLSHTLFSAHLLLPLYLYEYSVYICTVHT